MKISELITCLTHIQITYGDLPVQHLSYYDDERPLDMEADDLEIHGTDEKRLLF